ncbi:unnamed protein product [Agarophyton chilense]
MSHSSQNTKVEYTERRETNVAAKMANVWEQRIGSGKVHNNKPDGSSPSSIVKSSGSDVNREAGFVHAGSRKPLSRTNTEKIVKNYERMASLHKQESKNSFSPAARRASSVTSSGKGESGTSRKNIDDVIERIRSRMSEVDRDLRELKSMVSDL